MSRKQMIAIVVGAVVIVLLALFPPWRAVEGPFEASIRFDWIGRDPIHVWDARTGGIPALREPDIWDVAPGQRVVGKLEIQVGLLVVLQVAALALSLAAVLVLRDRKPSP